MLKFKKIRKKKKVFTFFPCKWA